MRKWIARAPSLAAAAAPGTALAHHGGPVDTAVGIGAAALAVLVLLAVLAAVVRPAIRR